ncbi:MAG: 50S ribosomal protein L19 [Cyanobacteria bacterium PR.3.49]|jgi:large subunit ribosomal protein L19|nr:50S ribosomal protein L19 [Cyanobacteria bacterium PR.3.49]
MNQIIQEIEAPLIKDNVPQMNIGDTVKVFVKIVEGNKERTQGYEGVIIKRRGSGVGETITVRRVFQGIGIERVFLVNSPRVEKITVQRRGHVRRAKLYYLRKRTGKATRIKEKVTGKKELVTAGAPAEKAAPAKAEKAAPAPAESAPETTSES